MIKNLSGAESSPTELRELVKWSVRMLGRVIEKEAGEPLYQFIEDLRKKMADLRDDPDAVILKKLESTFNQLKRVSPQERLVIARAYTLMLELMNACENAYRSHRLDRRFSGKQVRLPEVKKAPSGHAIIYVLTSHPTEARSPQSIILFYSIQRILIRALTLQNYQEKLEAELLHDLELAWRINIVREEAPQVSDEAEHIYSTVFKPEILSTLLKVGHEVTPFYLRTWVGGDKDGHPGVDEKVMTESLHLSRIEIVTYAKQRIEKILSSLALLPSSKLIKELEAFTEQLILLRTLKPQDGRKVNRLRKALAQLVHRYEASMGAIHPELLTLRQLFHVFPGLVVPLELRESSDVIMSEPDAVKKGSARKPKLAIDRMLVQLSKLSEGGDPRWYARGFIVSMTYSLKHLQVAEKKVRGAFGSARIPVIPLFEQIDALEASEEIIHGMINDRSVGAAIRDHWNGVVEMMVGYSDSSKEGGVLPSRLAIAKAMNRLDLLCEKEKVKALFFQGSGGSVDRGGGKIEDQIAWWPNSAVKVYKVTVQGEMVERSLSSPEITRGQLERIAQSATQALEKPAAIPHSPILQKFSDEISAAYREMTTSPDFLRVVEKATPYSDLTELKIGSRPTKRANQLSVKGLRAIPWVLCWTQTRVLFPTWWGIGSAWKKLTREEKDALKVAFAQEPVFSSFVRALGFTIAKVELPVFKVYLRKSGLEKAFIARFESLFDAEFEQVLSFLEWVSGQKGGDFNPLWFQPWLGASIKLRTPMIHPLNLLQMIALEERDFKMLRYTVTGIASGMLTTG